MSETPHEIVIIKRVSGGHEDEHHGGVWKIAFADFMTAMMAFFLVMWLISANDKTKAVIARYFNPVQLVDSTPQPKGLEDPKPGSPSVMPKVGQTPEARAKADKPEPKADAKDDPHATAETKTAAATEKAAKHDESDLFKDPYAVLTEIAGRPDEQPVREKKAPQDGAKGGMGAVGIKGGQAYRDPFEPLPLPPGAAAGNAFSDAVHTTSPEASTAALKSEAALPPAPPPQPAGVPSEPVPPSPATVATANRAAAPTTADKQTAGLAAKLQAAMQGPPSEKAGALPQLDVHRTGDGILIDLTDGTDFAMFASASAEPAPKMVRLMEKIGHVLKAQKGRITIRGYTDNRPFRSDTYDNWRLSAARAHMAHYMLVRGGVDELRFERIEGYADRQPRNPKDPGGPENRRIEILIRDAGE